MIPPVAPAAGATDPKEDGFRLSHRGHIFFTGQGGSGGADEGPAADSQDPALMLRSPWTLPPRILPRLGTVSLHLPSSLGLVSLLQSQILSLSSPQGPLALRGIFLSTPTSHQDQ